MWNVRELKNHLDLIGEQPKNYIEYLDSVIRTIDIFEFHKDEAFSVLSTLDSVAPEMAMKLVFSMGSEKNDLENKVISVQAHLHAALQNVRSMYDILAQLLNALLVHDPIPIHLCDICKVFKALPNGNVRSELEKILASFEYQYVNSFVNTIKHRNLVQFNRHLDLLEGRASIRIKPFSYSGNSYEQKWAIDALKHGLDVKNQLIAIGKLLNSECGVRNA
ncbi:MAG: hypothetical protein CVV11_20615 [Gammaproteobacteria bacterium HGW-Gammaproteobacteria-15]|nr:MAG: hypothetical protein CVV11_20615 [Gammaproteobacteria bacterium HGW-Gammaproteobacteria-15]